MRISLEAAREGFQGAWCTYFVRCGDFPDQATCLSANLQSRFATAARAGIAAVFPAGSDADMAVSSGRARVDLDAAQQCFDQIAANTCDRTDAIGRSATGEGQSANPVSCGAIVHGSLSEGRACASDVECTSQRCSTNPADCTMACCTGQCEVAASQPIAIGQPCDGATDSCMEGATCISSPSGDKRCRARLPQGASCQVDAECDYNLGCIQTCQPLPAVGQPCPNGVCRDEGVVCNSARMCAPGGLPGASCVTTADCSRFYECDATKHCAGGPVLGEGCMFDCFDRSVCNGICIAPLADGAFCGTPTGRKDDLCQSHYCRPDPGGDPRKGACAPHPECF